MGKVSNIGQVSYPRVFTAAEEADPGSMFKGYSIELLFEDEPTDIREAIEAAVNAKWSDTAKRKKALSNLKCIAQVPHPLDPERDVWRVRFKRPTSFGACAVVGPRLEVIEESDLYAGSMARVKYSAYCYDGDFGLGAGLGFQSVQKTGEGETFSRSSDLDGFDCID